MRPHKGSLARGERRWQLTETPSWAPVGWFSLLVGAAALTWSLCLPGYVTDLDVSRRPGQAFHLEWFLLATALAYLIWRAARSSWVVGIVGLLIASAQLLGIADEAAQRLQRAGLVSAETDMLYVIAVLQVAVFVFAWAVGARHSLADRRWARLTRQLAALDQTPLRPHP